MRYFKILFHKFLKKDPVLNTSTLQSSYLKVTLRQSKMFKKKTPLYLFRPSPDN